MLDFPSSLLGMGLSLMPKLGAALMFFAPAMSETLWVEQ
jgi:hypothetical protein